MSRPRRTPTKARAYARQVGTKLEIEAPYSSKFVTALNADIPKLAKQWKEDVPCTDANHHCCKGRWIISIGFKYHAIELLKAFYPIVEVSDTTGTHTHKWNGIM